MYVYMYVCVCVCVCVCVYLSANLLVSVMKSRERWYNFWHDARQPADLEPQGFSTFQRKNLRCYPSASSSNLITFNSASSRSILA